MAQSEAPLGEPELALPPADQLPDLADERLEELTDAVAAAERRLRAEMAPFQARLGQLRQDSAQLATEVRRRQRQRQIRSRQEVREQVRQGGAPSLADVVAAQQAPDFGEPQFSELTFLLETGGEVALGYPGSRTPSLQMTDGSKVEQVTSLALARRLFREGWEFGVPAKRGVRVHTPGTRLERLLEPEGCFVRPRREAGGPT